MVHSALLASANDPSPDHPPAARALGLGAMLMPIAHGNLFGWAIYGPGEAQAEALRLLSDVALRPSFPATALQIRGARERQRIVSTGEGELGTLIAVAVGHALGLGRPLRLEAPASLCDSLHREDVVRHWRRWVRPEHAVLVVSGRAELGSGWTEWRNPTEVPPTPTTCLPHGQSAHLIVSSEEPGGDVLLLLAAAIPGLGTPERSALSAWFSWLGERPGGPIEALVGPQQARRAAPTVVDLAMTPGRTVAVAIAGTRGPEELAISDLQLVSGRFQAPPEAGDRPGLEGALAAARAERVVLRERPIARLVATAEDALFGVADVTTQAEDARRSAKAALAPWRYTFAGLGAADFESSLESLAPVTRWTRTGEAVGGAQPRRCERPSPSQGDRSIAK